MAHSAKKVRAITVCLVEAHPVVAQVLSSTLHQSRMKCVWRGTEIPFESLARKNDLVVVVDAGFLQRSLSKFLHLARPRLKPETRYLIVDRRRTAQELLDLFSLGVHGFIAYERVKRDLEHAIRCVAQGNLWMDGRKVAELATRYELRARRASVEEPSLLTSREKDVMGLIERRLSNKEIASALSIRECTVRFHLGHIFAKLGVHDRYSAAERAKADAAIRAEAAPAGAAL
jgi:DNA-binding NarL/FixJ family response regulator